MAVEKTDEAGSGQLYQVHPAMPPRLALPALNFHQAWWFQADPSQPEAMTSAPTKAALLEVIKDLLNRGLSPNSTVKIRNINGIRIDERRNTVLQTDFLSSSMAISPKGDVTATDLPPEPNRHDVDQFAMWLTWNDMLVRLAIAVHSEYFTVTLWSLFTISKIPGKHERKICAGNEELCGHLSLLWNPLLRAARRWKPPGFVPGPRQTGANATKRAAAALYDGHNEKLFKALFPRWKSNPVFAETNKFANFRSVILPSELRLSGDLATTESTIAHPADILDAMAGIFNGFNATQPELMGSLFLDGRVAYVSSLGAHHKLDHKHPGSVSAVRYLMYAENVSRWQMGRLVERLNTLGTYRQAALRDLAALNKVSDGMRGIGAALDRPDLTDDQFNAEYAAFQLLKNKGGCRLPDDGILFRIERSRFYVTAFTGLVGDLRNHRVSGYQSYPDFVQRRYRTTWDRIDRIGIRHERLARRLDYLSNQRKFLQQVEQTKQQVNQTTELRRAADTQAQLLHTAERVSVIPIAYYSEKALGTLLVAMHADSLKPGAFFLAVVIFSLVMIWSIDWHGTKRRTTSDQKEAMLWTCVLFAGAVAAILTASADKPKDPAKPLPSEPAAPSGPSLPSPS
jgi:hypothetical protein